MNHDEQVAAIYQVAEAIGETVSTDYSGRGMFGKTCYSIDCDNLTECLMEVGKANLPVPSTDNMGKGYVVYWPDIQYKSPAEISAEKPMKTYKVYVEWSMTAVLEVPAHSLEEAIKKAESEEPPYDRLPEDEEYLDGSFEVNKDMTQDDEDNRWWTRKLPFTGE